MAILFACQSATCPDRDIVVEFLSDAPRAPACDCGAVMEPVDLSDPGPVADYILGVLAPAGS